jgi:exodeoxyribonuclease X
MPIIRVYDFETTGMEPPTAEVCEVGWCDLINDGDEWRIRPGGSLLCGVSAMPPEVRAIHHISLADCEGREVFSPDRLWEQVAAEQIDVVAAHNLEFEAKFWGTATVPTLCTYKAALRAWPEAPSHSNGALRYWLEDQGIISPEHELTMPPHRAEPDAYVTAWLLSALLLTETANDMVRWTKEPRVLPTCPLGKFRGKKWSDVDHGFLQWMLSQPTMEDDLKWNARHELDRREVVL